MAATEGGERGPGRLLGRLVQARPGETAALLWSFAYFFCLLAGYYVLRPLRDEMGVVGGTRNLPWLFTATFIAILLAAPVLAATVAALPRKRFIPLIYNFFVLNIGVFWLLLTLHVNDQLVARIFFVWITVFNVFAVSVFWSFMADLYRSDQAKRLFGFIAAGGSLGAIVGPLLTASLAKPIGPTNLLIVAAVLLELAVVCAFFLERAAKAAKGDGAVEEKPAVRPAQEEKIGGNLMAGFAMIFRSPYLGGIAGWVFLLSLAGTFIYLMQAEIVAGASSDSAERLRIFATIDASANSLNLIVQALITGRLITRFGVGAALAFLPLVFVLGFSALAAAPAVLVVIGLQTLQRSANFAISNPAREILFTATTREEKFKSKSVIDGVVFRGADAANAQAYGLLQTVAGLGLQGLALIAIPLSLGWMGLSLWLGKTQERRAAAQSTEPPPAPQP